MCILLELTICKILRLSRKKLERDTKRRWRLCPSVVLVTPTAITGYFAQALANVS
jgi:hypothetical protein